jgi:hypothetical protein
MKRSLSIVILSICISFIFSSCATVFGGRVSDFQKTKPKEGEPARAVRGAALVADIILFWPGTIVDFATGAIYKPTKN